MFILCPLNLPNVLSTFKMVCDKRGPWSRVSTYIGDLKWFKLAADSRLPGCLHATILNDKEILMRLEFKAVCKKHTHIQSRKVFIGAVMRALPLMCPEFNSQHHMTVDQICCWFSPCSKRFSPDNSSFPPSSKINISKF